MPPSEFNNSAVTIAAACLVSPAAGDRSNKRTFTNSFCLFPPSFRRKLLGAFTCGGSCSSSGRKKHKFAIPAMCPVSPSRRGSDRLSDLLKLEEEDEEEEEEEEDLVFGSDGVEERRRRTEKMRAAVGRLEGSERAEATEEVRRLAKDDKAARAEMAAMGAIPAIVRMIGDDGIGDEKALISAFYALLNLGIGNDANKAAIVQAGAIHKMIAHLSAATTSPSVASAITANLLSLTALDANKPKIGASGAIPFLTRSYAAPTSPQSKHDSLRALYNLSLHPRNVPALVASNLLPSLLAAAPTDLTLSVLCNLIPSPAARKAVNGDSDAVAAVVDALGWEDEPSCQEKAAYVLMVLAYKGGGVERTRLVEAGIVSACLELTLLGSALAQKRASRVLEFLTAGRGRGKQVSESFASTPGMVVDVGGGGGLEEGESEERAAVKELVQQSLQSNMRRITRRANLEFAVAAAQEPRRVLTNAPTSRSLPF